MRAAERLAALARLAARRPAVVLAIITALAAGGGLLALGLSPSAGTDTLVGRGSVTYRATTSYHEHFGDEAVIVLVRGPLSKLVLTQDVERVLGLEGCLSGNIPSGAVPPGGARGPCAQLAQARSVQVVYGPGTFINESVRQIGDQFTQQSSAKAAEAARAERAAYQLARGQGRSPAQARHLGAQARKLVYAEFTRTVLQLALRYGLTSVPRLNDPDFVSTLVFDTTKTPGTPKARFAYLFPNANSALIQVRLRPGLSDTQRSHTIALVRRAVRMPQWGLTHGGSYVVTGVPVIVSDLTGSITRSILALLIASVLVMAATLALVFRVRLRLLPLAIALAATAVTFGGLALVGSSLTMASIGVLPVLIGLSVDYAIQFQSRLAEVSRRDPDAGIRAVTRAARLGAPTIATAAAATAGGFLALALSPVPMVRGFGLLLVVGIAVSFVCALAAVSATLALGTGGRRPAAWSGWRGGALGALAAAWRGAGELVSELVPRDPRGRMSSSTRVVLEHSLTRPRRVLGIGLALAVVGWGLGFVTPVESDIQKLVPQNLQALRDLSALQRSTGVGGEIDVLVGADDLTRPDVVSWMTSYQGVLLSHFGFASTRGCGRAQLCPAFSLPDLFQTQGSAPSQAAIRSLLDSVPPYFSQGVITRDRRTATLAFGIRLMALDQQQRVIDFMRSQLHPPVGVSAQLAGLPVLAAEANQRVASPWRRLETLLAGLLAVALVLLVALRGARRALVPLVPILLSTGWSALVLFALRVPLNPMSVTLGALVVAISTEFSVLLSERYRQERIGGRSHRDALQRTYRITGSAVLASGATAIAGFAVLAVSDIRMLRDFGLVTVVDLTVSLAGVLVALPAALALAEQRELRVASGRPQARRVWVWRRREDGAPAA